MMNWALRTLSVFVASALAGLLAQQTNAQTVKATTPTERDLVLMRVFNAPRDRVFDALTKPYLVMQWYKPMGKPLAACEIDLKVGGGWRFLMQLPDGKKMEIRGVYREVKRPERLVNTETYDNSPLELLITTVLAEHAGKTTLTATIRHPSQTARDENYPGIVRGSEEIYNNLAELLAKPQPAQ
jgi:uncharacterized protein YndB with AHSA1/START domain